MRSMERGANKKNDAGGEKWGKGSQSARKQTQDRRQDRISPVAASGVAKVSENKPRVVLLLCMPTVSTPPPNPWRPPFPPWRAARSTGPSC